MAARAAHWISEYLRTLGERPVMSALAPGALRASLPRSAPEEGAPLELLLQDFDRLIVPGITHWQHPRFLTYFSAAGSNPGTLAELLIAGLNVNGMLWQTSPAVTELEEVTTAWLRDAMGLPEVFSGIINDTASSGTLYALTAAREALVGASIRADGAAGHELRLYCSEEAHSSVEKAAIVLGVGQRGVVKIPTDAAFRMRPDLLHDAIRSDRLAGREPFAVVATVGTTSVTAVDPVAEIATICEGEKLWLHVDAAYGGAAALVPSHRWVMEGCERADSLVVNPHKWMFTPIDCSVLFCRREDVLRQAFSLVPPYLSSDQPVRNLMDYGTSLGRRFRSLKLWFVMRAFGMEGIRERISQHIHWAQQLRSWITEEPGWEVLAPTHFSTVVFRRVLSSDAESDAENERIVAGVNAGGSAFISHTSVRGRYAIRIAIGNLRTTLEDVQLTWGVVRENAG